MSEIDTLLSDLILAVNYYRDGRVSLGKVDNAREAIRAANAALEAQVRELREMGGLIQTQDNRCTSHPIYVVQRERRIYGVSPEYSDHFLWAHEDEGDTIDPKSDEWQELEDGYQAGNDAPEGFVRVGYTVVWEWVQPFFTEKAADDYIAANRHNLTNPRVYVESGYRNYEWQAVRATCQALAQTAPAGEGEGPCADCVRYEGIDYESPCHECERNGYDGFIPFSPADLANVERRRAAALDRKEGE